MTRQKIVTVVSSSYPSIEAIYLFGSHGTLNERAGSDVDIALLLPHPFAISATGLRINDLRFNLESVLNKPVDLVNLRQVSTVFQKEIVFNGVRILTRNLLAADEFEMLTLSFYQKLNDERAEIIAEFKKTGRAYAV